MISLHFDNTNGSYASYEHEKYTKKEFDNGNKIPSRLLFSDSSFDETNRRFSGVLNYAGNSMNGSTSVRYELSFDSKFLCVVSGKIVCTKSNEKADDSESSSKDSSYSDNEETIGEDKNFGVDICYTNTNLNNVDVDTRKRLEEEGATAKTILPFLGLVLERKYNTGNKYGELTEGYIFTTKWRMDEDGKYEYGEERTEYVDMSQPRPSSYQRKNNETWEYETIPLVVPLSIDTPTTPPVQYRAITLRQLRAVEAIIKRRCIKEGWKNHEGKDLSPETVTLYDVNKYIILPFTEDRQEAFVTCLPSTTGPQKPRFFGSHWWGEPVVDFIRCYEQVVRDFSQNEREQDERRGGGLTADTPLWVCAYGNNQHNLSEDISDDPRESGFTRAMRAAEGRTLSILDKGGVVFERIWCGYELYLTLVDNTKNAIWAVYTTYPHTYDGEERESIGIISGGLPSDKTYCFLTARRDVSLPFDLIKQSLSIKVDEAKASVEKDRVRILNTIIGRGGNDMNEKPPTIHPKYDEVNAAVIAAFVSRVDSMQGMCKETDDTWRKFLTALSKGKRILRLSLNFGENGWKGLKGGRAAELVFHLPATVSMLKITNADFGVGFIDAICEHVKKTTTLNYLELVYVYAGEEEGREAGVCLAEAMAKNKTVTCLKLRKNTDLVVEDNVEQWGAALNANRTLTTLDLGGVETEIKEKLYEITKDRKYVP